MATLSVAVRPRFTTSLKHLFAGWHQSCHSQLTRSGTRCRANAISLSLLGEWYEGLFGLAEGEELNNEFWAEIQAVRGGVNKLLEDARKDKTIGGSLQAEVTLYAEEALAAKLGKLEDELRFALLTSAAVVKPLRDKSDAAHATDVEGLFVEVNATENEKCDRCWHHTPDVGTIEGHEKICGRCVSNVDGEGEVRKFA